MAVCEQPPVVLLAGDDNALRSLYSRGLRRDGFEVLEAGDGLTAPAQAGRSPGLAILSARAGRASP
jgi:DNA-binding response OmpR family regulator